MHSAVLRRAIATSLAAGLGLVAATASAGPSLELTSTVGRLSYGGGATELLVEVRNPDRTPIHGTIELRRSGGRDDESLAARAPFDVPAGERRYIRMPVASGSTRFLVAALDDQGVLLVQAGEERADRTEHTIFEIPPSDDERLHDLKSNVVHESDRNKHNETVSLAHAAVDTSGAPILTERAVMYEGISLVVVPARMLGRLVPAQREALLAWVRTGGSLALGIADARELAGLEELVGAGVRMVPEEELPADQDVSGALAQKLVGYQGGRLTVGPFGGVASFGLGNVHLLALDPWSADANGNAWVQEQLALVAAASPTRFHTYDSGTTQAVKYLDPNGGYRSVIVLVGLLLAAHAIGTALGFRRLALRRGMGPAYRFAAATSAVSFAAVVGLGIHARGGLAARSRELAVVDVASGERLAWVQRTRAFYARDARRIDVTPRDPMNLLTPIGRDGREPGVRVDTNVVSLVGLQVHPWQTAAVVEKGTTTLPGAVTIRRDADTIFVRNDLGQPLRNVLVSDRSHLCLAFAEIPAGAEVTSASATSSGACTVMSESAPWRAFDMMLAGWTDPQVVGERRLTLVGQLDPKEGPPDDGGMPVDQRKVIVHVVGGAS